MALGRALTATFKSSSLISWKPNGKLQQTVASCIERSGQGLHSGKVSTVRIWPELAGRGRYFEFRSCRIPASIEHHAQEARLCTTLRRDGYSISTVEHLLSALEATGVDNCKIEIQSSDDHCVEVPIFDGSAREWVEAIKQVGLKMATDCNDKSCEKMAPFLNEPVHVWKNDSFVTAFPCSQANVTYGIDFPQAPAIGRQWSSFTLFNDSLYVDQIAPSRTFCIYEESFNSTGFCNWNEVITPLDFATRGWLNLPLRFQDEPCRHKVLDLIGDVSLFARAGSQGLPMAHIIAYKAGHALHAELVRVLSGIS